MSQNAVVMTAPTDATILENLRTAYNDLISGRISSYEVDGQKITYQSIATLESMIGRWEARVNAGSGRAVTYARVSRP